MRQGSTPALLGLILALASGAGRAVAGEEVEVSLPDSALGRLVHPILLLSRPDVRSDLALDATQEAAARRALRAFSAQATALRGKPNDAETIRGRRAVDEAASGWIDAKLSAEQRSRLVQVHLQWEGPSALVKRPIVAESLRLSEPQKARLAEAVRRRDASRAKGDPGAEAALAQDALQCLSESQREGWKQMMGRPFSPRLAATGGAAHATR